MFYIRIDKKNNLINSISYKPIDTQFEYSVAITEDIVQFCEKHPYLTSGACYYINNELIYKESEHEALQLQNQQEKIRKMRQDECFPYINRGQLWYAKLTEKQLQELSQWYELWLNAPTTLNIPPKPKWLE